MARKVDGRSATAAAYTRLGVDASTRADLEFAYKQSCANHAAVIQEEEIRALRLKNVLLQHQTTSLHEELAIEAERADVQAQEAAEWQRRAVEVEDHLHQVERELNGRIRDLEITKSELASLQGVSADSSKLLTEKLTLARELAQLKPELEHLRANSSEYSVVLSDKLKLQQELSVAQAELNSKRLMLKNTQAKGDKHNNVEATLHEEIERLQSQLNEAQRKLKQNKSAPAQRTEVTGLQAELASERQEHEKERVEWQTQKVALEEKLNQFRTKLKATKEKLKDAEEQLAGGKTVEPVAVVPIPSPSVPRKRDLPARQPDVAIGTPGDGPANKRTKRAPENVGAQSTFSITPFLNRTANVLANTPPQPEAENVADSVEDNQSPTLAAAERADADRNELMNFVDSVLGEASPAKVPQSNDGAAIPDPSHPIDADDNNAVIASPDNEKENQKPQAPKPTGATKLGPKKSLSSFATFREGSLPPVHQKKKRKLGGAPSKTLFDEDEAEDAEAGGFGGQRAFGTFAPRATGVARPLAGKRKGPVVVAEDGFAFSPLKKDKKALRTAAAAG